MHFDELDSQPTDANLVCLALHGDTAAFDALDNRYRVTVYKVRIRESQATSRC